MKKINSGVCFVIIVAFVCLFFQTGHAATYYVKNSGNDNASGLDDSSAWRTITKVNSFNFSEGDVVLFKRGDTFSDKGLRISNVDNFTIADYGEGEKPLFDGNKIKPIYIADSKNITIRNINISGQEWHIDKSANIGLSNVENIIIDGVYGDGHTFEGTPATDGKSAIGLVNCSGTIEIKNCELFNWGPYDMLDSFGTLKTDYFGIYLGEMKTGEYKIHNNKIYNIYADCIALWLTTATGKIYDNILYNAGEDSIDVKGTENCEIYNNEFYRTPDFLGEGGSGSGGIPTYVIVHEASETGDYAKNNTIRNNIFRDGDAAGIKLGKAENTIIYENTFSNVKSSLYIQNFVTNTKFHHNIIENPQSREEPYRDFDEGCIYENNGDGEGTQIFNNTIYNKNGSAKHLVMLDNTNGTAVYNNIVYQNNASEDAFGLYRNVGTEPIIRDNYWYNPNKINRIKYSNKIYTANMQEEWNEKHPGDKFDNPLMNDPEEGDYSLYDTSLKIGAVYGDQAEESLDGPLTKDTEEGDYSLYDKSLNTGALYSKTGDAALSGVLALEVLIVYFQNPGADLQQLTELVYQKTETWVSTQQIQMLLDELFYMLRL
jgi:parallel beta-helix repeat protein